MPIAIRDDSVMPAIAKTVKTPSSKTVAGITGRGKLRDKKT
jgi:hypothetical protein